MTLQFTSLAPALSADHDDHELRRLASLHVRAAQRLLTDAENAIVRGHVARAQRLYEKAELEMRTAEALRVVAREAT